MAVHGRLAKKSSIPCLGSMTIRFGCGRLLHTALSLCKELKAINKFWSLWVRPDDRLAASCYQEEIKSKRLESIVEISKEIEAKTVFRSSKAETLKESHVTLLDR